VTERFAVGERASADVQGSFRTSDRAAAAAAGTRLLGAEPVGLLFQQGGEGSFGQASSGGRRDLLHGVEIDVGVGSRLAEGATGDHLAPVASQLTDILEILGGELPMRHGQSCLVFARIGGDAFLLPLYDTVLCLAKQVLTS
jgi:hypothetical protein